MVAGWNLLTNDAAIRRKVREIRAGVTEDDDPVPVVVSFWNEVMDPIERGVEVEEDGEVPEGVQCLNVSIVAIPSGLHLPPEGTAGLRWHPTGEMIEGVPEMRQVPNLVTAEEAKVLVGPPKPSRVDAGVVADHVPEADMGTVGSIGGMVTAEEIAMARAEAKAMREDVRQIVRGQLGLLSKRTYERHDYSSLLPPWPGSNPPR